MITAFQHWITIEGRLTSFVRKRVLDKAATQDIVQDVFIQFHQQLHTLKDSERWEAWIFRVARNRIADLYRGAQRRMESTLVGDDVTLNQACSACLREEIRALPENYRRVLELAELQSVPQKHLAMQFGLSYSGLKSRVQRSREMLRQRMVAKYRMASDRYGNILECEPRDQRACQQVKG